MSRQSPEETIRAWTEAYTAANGYAPPGPMTHSNGWYRTRFNTWRARQVNALTSALIARQAAKATGQ